MTDNRSPWHLRQTLQLLHHAVDVLDTARTPRRRLEGALHELLELEYDELLQGPHAEKFLAVRAATKRAPAPDEDDALAASVAALSDDEVTELMDLIRSLHGELRHEWDAARGKGDHPH